MPSLANARNTFHKRIDESENIVSSVEALWQMAPRGSQVRHRIGEPQLSALYEMAYLSIFCYWENFIEECLIRMMVGQKSSTYTPTIAGVKSPTLTAARTTLLGGKQFLLWYNPIAAADRVALQVLSSPLENTLRLHHLRIAEFAAIRHAVAHKSDDAIASFQTSSLSMTGVAHPSPGGLLRNQDNSDPLNPVRWIRVISNDLRQFATDSTA
jgi:hypothetical protein